MRQLRNFSVGNGGKAGGESERKAAEEIMNKYGNMDEDALIGQLMSNIERQKNEGTFDPESIKNFAGTMGPYLTEEQKQKLNNLINIISANG